MIDTLTQPEFIDISKLELPDHTKELYKIGESISELNTTITEIITTNRINSNVHTFYFEEVVKQLDFVGQLSVPAFSSLDIMDDMYFKAFKDFPALAKKLWLEHYDKIHRPYTILKNRCHRLMVDLDEAYINKYNTNPPNWEI